MTFEQLSLNSSLLKAIQIRGYDQPTPVQKQVIPLILQGKDVLASAQTGTGKTAAFVLPALERLTQSQPEKKSPKKPRVLILAPTRELADQITNNAQQYGKFLPFMVNSITGGIPYGKQLKALARGNDILVATPGRLLDHMEHKHLDLSAVEMLVIDEFDRMLDMGFIDDVKHIIKMCPEERQTLLFSATVDKQLVNLTAPFLNEAQHIHLAPETQQKALIDQQLYLVRSQQHKDELLAEILAKEPVFKAIVFSGTKRHCEVLADQLSAQGYLACALHGDLKQRQRQAMLDKLRRNKVQILVATDVAARGIDVTDITHVVNYDFPRFAEDYVHRIGRTGRAGKKGIAISFVATSEIRYLKSVEKFSGQNFSLIKPEGMENFKTERPSKGKSDRPQQRSRFSQERSFGKRPSRSANSERSEGRNFSDRRERNANGNRSGNSERTERPGYAGRSERSGNTERSERTNYGDRSARSASQGDRSERSTRFSQEGRGRNSERTERSGYAGRSERSGNTERSERSGYAGRTGNSDRSERSGYAARTGNSERSERSGYAGRSEGGRSERSGYAGRTGNSDRSERPAKSGYANRAKSYDRGERASNSARTRRDFSNDNASQPARKQPTIFIKKKVVRETAE